LLLITVTVVLVLVVVDVGDVVRGFLCALACTKPRPKVIVKMAYKIFFIKAKVLACCIFSREIMLLNYAKIR